MRTKLFFAAILLSCCAAAQNKDVQSLQGKPLPALKMTDTTGKVHTNKSLRGKVVLLDFWATWCGPCKMASPTIQKLHTKYGKKGLMAFGANVFEDTDKLGAPKKYAREHKYTYRFTANNDAFANSVGISSIPAFLLVDKKGIVRLVQIGFNPQATPKVLETTIQKLLAER